VTLDCRVALVTGGGRGIGRAIAVALSNAGARVAVAARSRVEVDAVVRELTRQKRQGLALTCDVTSRAAVERAFAEVIEKLGPIDVLVNNAGFVESAPIHRLDEGLWSRTIAVNLTGTYLCTRQALSTMVDRGRGRIINIASIAGRVPFLYTAAYCAAKHGVIGFTRAVALEMATKGITVNAVCPGWVDTDMTKSSIERIVSKTGRTPDEVRRTLEEMSPQRRLIQPEEVAAVAVFLAGDDAAGITGQAIDVDGGEVMA
jgi:NAD(P)-dependent dehydrogenase (short-subunit alcohol dehydrogenase family)